MTTPNRTFIFGHQLQVGDVTHHTGRTVLSIGPGKHAGLLRVDWARADGSVIKNTIDVAETIAIVKGH